MIFLLIVMLTFGVQLLITEYGGQAVRCVPLDWQQNCICLGIGCGSLFWGMLMKAVVPASWFNCMLPKQTKTAEEEELALQNSTFKKMRTSLKGNSLSRSATEKSTTPK